MFEMLTAFVVANWQNILVVAVFVMASVYLWIKGYKSNVALYMLHLIGIAENNFSHGENKEKLQSVVDGMYQKFPSLLRFFYQEQDLINLINKMVKDTKKWLQNQTK